MEILERLELFNIQLKISNKLPFQKHGDNNHKTPKPKHIHSTYIPDTQFYNKQKNQEKP